MAKEPAGTIQAASRMDGGGVRIRRQGGPGPAKDGFQFPKTGAPFPLSEARNELPLFCINLVAARFPLAPPEGPRLLRELLPRGSG